MQYATNSLHRKQIALRDTRDQGAMGRAPLAFLIPRPLKKAGVGAVSVTAFTYDIHTIPTHNNGVLGATLTFQMVGMARRPYLFNDLV